MIKSFTTFFAIMLAILLVQHIVFFLFTKNKSKSQFTEGLPSIFLAALFIGTAITLILKFVGNYNSVIIYAFLFSVVSSGFWFVINPFKFLMNPKSYKRNTELENELKSEGYNYKILVTEKIKANALATGIIPFYRIILIGNYLQEQLDPANLKAIIYHEIGHHRKNHMLKIYVINIIIQVAFFMVYSQISKIEFEYPILEPLSVFLTGALMGLVIWVIPNRVLYFFEYHADGFAAKNYNKTAIIETLKKLDEISGGKLTKGNINHPTLTKRLTHLERL